MATGVASKELEVLGSRPQAGWVLGGIAVLALAGVVMAAVAVLSSPPTVRPIDNGRVAPLYTADELTIMRLVAAGLIPEETLDGEPFRTKGLIAKGLLPRESLEAMHLPAPPLYCAKERALIAAVAQGVVPEEVLEGEPFRTKRLINQGLVSRKAAEPC